MARTSATEQAATRRRLLDAAKAEFAERGLAGARFDEISLAAGHAKGTIYNYFASKQELFLAVVADWCAVLLEQLDATGSAAVDTANAADTDTERSCRQRLVDVATADAVIAQKDPQLARVVMQQMPSLVGQDREATLAALAPGLDLVTELFDEGLRSGEFVSVRSPALLARLFLGVLNTLEIEALDRDPLLSLADVAALIDDHVLAGLAPSPT